MTPSPGLAVSCPLGLDPSPWESAPRDGCSRGLGKAPGQPVGGGGALYAPPQTLASELLHTHRGEPRLWERPTPQPGAQSRTRQLRGYRPWWPLALGTGSGQPAGSAEGPAQSYWVSTLPGGQKQGHPLGVEGNVPAWRWGPLLCPQNKGHYFQIRHILRFGGDVGFRGTLLNPLQGPRSALGEGGCCRVGAGISALPGGPLTMADGQGGHPSPGAAPGLRHHPISKHECSPLRAHWRSRKKVSALSGSQSPGQRKGTWPPVPSHTRQALDSCLSQHSLLPHLPPAGEAAWAPGVGQRHTCHTRTHSASLGLTPP